MSWRTAHASEPGTSHAADGIPCQDHHIVDEVGEHLIIAIADGAGSAPLSELGASVACTWAVQYLKSNCTDDVDIDSVATNMENAFKAARLEVENTATRKGVTSRDLASTLLVAFVARDFAVFGQVGDGVAIYDAGSELALAHWPEQEAINITDFITSAPLTETMIISRAPGRINRIVLMTDGLMHLLIDYRTQRPHAPALERLLAACSSSPDPAALNEDLRLFLSSDAVNERSDDDKTLVLAIREAVL